MRKLNARGPRYRRSKAVSRHFCPGSKRLLIGVFYAVRRSEFEGWSKPAVYTRINSWSGISKDNGCLIT